MVFPMDTGEAEISMVSESALDESGKARVSSGVAGRDDPEVTPPPSSTGVQETKRRIKTIRTFRFVS